MLPSDADLADRLRRQGEGRTRSTRQAASDRQDSPCAPHPDPSDHLAVGIQVFRDLLRIEDRPNRVRRVLRIWESKVSTAIRSRDLGRRRGLAAGDHR